MGKIRGDVEAVGIANLLQMLSAGGCVGVLTVGRNFQKKSIQIGQAGMRLLSTGSKKSSPLGELLIRSGRIQQSRLNELMSEQRKSGIPLAALVVQCGILSKEDLQRATQEQFAEEIYELFTWKGASFEFTGSQGEGAAEDEVSPADLALDSNATSVILQASRLADELARIQTVIHDVRMVPVRLSAIPTASDDPRLPPEVLQVVLPLIDGRRSVNDIIEESKSARFLVLGTLYELVQKGVLEIRNARGATAVRRRSSPVLAPPRSGCSILLLVNASDVLRELGAHLRTAGYTVHEGSATGDFAVLIGKNPVHAIVLEAWIDTDEGVSRSARLKATTSIPFICFSGDAKPEAVASAQRSGARYVLLKPIREDLLLERLAEMVQWKDSPERTP
jgi:CheY-like chemotaxis protein